MIAVNICRLSDWDPDGNGTSQYPLSMEAVFPIGPLAVSLTPDGKIDGPTQNVPRFAVRKASGKEIETAIFLTPDFAGVSAVIQAHQRDMHERGLVLSTIHNPLAVNKLPVGLFGVYKEFVAKEHDDGYRIRDVRLEARLRELVESVTLRFGRREDRVVRTITAAEAGDFVGELGKCHDNVSLGVSRTMTTPLRVDGWFRATASLTSIPSSTSATANSLRSRLCRTTHAGHSFRTTGQRTSLSDYRTKSSPRAETEQVALSQATALLSVDSRRGDATGERR